MNKQHAYYSAIHAVFNGYYISTNEANKEVKYTETDKDKEYLDNTYLKLYPDAVYVGVIDWHKPGTKVCKDSSLSFNSSEIRKATRDKRNQSKVKSEIF